MSSPKTTDAWIIQDTKGFDSLVLKKDVPIPELGDHDVLVQIEAVSLNYRDLIIPQVQAPSGYPKKCILTFLVGKVSVSHVAATGGMFRWSWQGHLRWKER